MVTQVEKWNEYTNRQGFDGGLFKEDVKRQVISLYRSEEEAQKNFNKMVHYAKALIEKHFQIELPEINTYLNRRLKATCGYFKYNKYTREPISITISMQFATALDDSFVLDVLLHEYTHYALFYMGREHDDGTFEFEQTLYQLDIGSNYYDSEQAVVYYSYNKTMSQAKHNRIPYGKRTWNKL